MKEICTGQEAGRMDWRTDWRMEEWAKQLLYASHSSFGGIQTVLLTRNIFKKDIRRLSNTDDKRNQIRWFRRGRNTPGPL